MKIFYTVLIILILSGCKTIDNKSQEAIKKENEKLSKFLQKSESELQIVMGKPDKIILTFLSTIGTIIFFPMYFIYL